jgi:catechol 2,3-dioxygenase-like lactoylglutathione lyase family enzyme
MIPALLEAVALDHVGLAAARGSTALTGLLGSAPVPREMPSGVTVGRFGPGGMLELVWERRPDSPITAFLERRGPGLHHVALRVAEPLGELAARLAEAGVRLAGPVEPSSDGRPSLFVHPRSTGGVLVELVEGPR